MSDAILILTSVLIEIGITAILIALIVYYKDWRRYTVVHLASVIPWLLFYVVFTVYYLSDPGAIDMGLGFIFVLSFIFFGLSLIVGIIISLVPFPRNLKVRFLIGLTAPFILYGFREFWIIMR